LTKAFNTLSREGLWKIMAIFTCKVKFINIVQQLHVGMNARVQEQVELSEPFPVSSENKGCVIASTLFSIMFSAMLRYAFKDDDIGVDIKYQTDGKLFNLRRLSAKIKVKPDTIIDLLFADDCNLTTSTEDDLQRNIDRYSQAWSKFWF
jgi:hypothetical protein